MRLLNLPVWRSWWVHFYTGLGLICALLSANAIAAREPFQAVIWAALAMLIDGTDGIFARRWQVKKWLPHFDGRKLDDIIDFLNYTFLPVFFAYQFEIVRGNWSMVLFPVLLVSAYGFCSDRAKTADGFFTGFPSYWNGVVLYLYWLQWPSWLAGTLILLLAILTLLPTRYISLNQTVQFKSITVTLLFLWTGVLLWIITGDFSHPDPRLVYASLFFPAYYFLASLYLHFTARDSSGNSV